MKQKNNPTRTWQTLFVLASVLFIVVGSVMVLVDTRYFMGAQYLITGIIFAIAFYLSAQKKISLDNLDPKLYLGFIFSVIGLTTQVGIGMTGMWALGIILFVSGLFYSKK